MQVSKEDLKDPDNLLQCECGNYAHHEYISSADDGAKSCPSCQLSYMDSLIKMYRELVKEIADPALTKSDINAMHRAKLCALHGIGVEDAEFLGDETEEL